MENIKEKSSPFVGQKIKAARRSANLTLEELGRRIGISNQALSAIEKGKNNPSKQTLINLAKELGDDFGEDWLADVLRDANIPKLIPPQGLREYKPRTMREWIGALLSQSTVTEKPHEPDYPVSGWVPMVGVIGEFYNAFNKVGSKARNHVMVAGLPPDKKVIGITYYGPPSPDACFNSGDILIVTTPPKSIKGEAVLLFLGGRFIVRRWLLKGNKVRLIPIDGSDEPLELPRKQVECLGRFVGVMRFVKYELPPLEQE